MCLKRTIHSYICVCNLEDILLIYPDISITLPENILFSEIYTYVSNKLTYHPVRVELVHYLSLIHI